MSHSGGVNHLAGLQSGLLDDDDQMLFMRLNEYNTSDYSMGDASRSPPRASANPLDVLQVRRPEVSENWGIGKYLGECLEDLEISGDYDSSRFYDGTFDRADNIYMDSDPSLSMANAFNSTSSPHSVKNSTDQGHTTLTPSQTSYYTESSSPWQRSPEGSSVNLQLPTYTSHESSTAAHSQYSDSAWETMPSTPSADDYDLRPIPDDSSASMQSYNHSQTGIWPQEHTYGRTIPVLPIGTDVNPGVNSAVASSPPQRLQEVFSKADAATPFGTDIHLDRGAPLEDVVVGPDLGVGMVTPSLSPMPISGDPVPQLFQFSPNGQAGVLIMINGRVSFPAFSVTPRIVPDNATPLGISLPPTMSPNPLDLASSPYVTPGTLATDVVECVHRGCHAKFTGKSRKDALRRHKRIVHGNKPKPICPKCHLVIKSGRPDNLKRHITEKHPGHLLPASLNVRTTRSNSAVPNNHTGRSAKTPGNSLAMRNDDYDL